MWTFFDGPGCILREKQGQAFICWPRDTNSHGSGTGVRERGLFSLNRLFCACVTRNGLFVYVKSMTANRGSIMVCAALAETAGGRAIMTVPGSKYALQRKQSKVMQIADITLEGHATRIRECTIQKGQCTVTDYEFQS